MRKSIVGLVALVLTLAGCSNHKHTNYVTDQRIYPSLKEVPSFISYSEETDFLKEQKRTKNIAVYTLDGFKITQHRIRKFKSKTECSGKWAWDYSYEGDITFYSGNFKYIREERVLEIAPTSTYPETTKKTEETVYFRRIEIEKGEYETKGKASSSSSSSSGLLYSQSSASAHVDIKSAQEVLYSEVDEPEVLYDAYTNIMVVTGEQFWLSSWGGMYNKLPEAKPGDIMKIVKQPYSDFEVDFQGQSFPLEPEINLDRFVEGRVGSLNVISLRKRTKD